ncbi:hypothetical protein N657DRAFT_104422 [Parathielavia appendiculata]|uniref:Uncharacterized protein n=1 Tax=Parathielavia appendiculata TaxID=2587402 RepID=A0AAN6TWD4_9PEZI|nr:hypothetical protein N657DRAFT_104422 [Parathielavia appendiculata]
MKTMSSPSAIEVSAALEEAVVLVARDNYRPGTPRKFNEPSFHACGKSRQDTDKVLLKCSGCIKAERPGFATRIVSGASRVSTRRTVVPES